MVSTAPSAFTLLGTTAVSTSSASAVEFNNDNLSLFMVIWVCCSLTWRCKWSRLEAKGSAVVTFEAGNGRRPLFRNSGDSAIALVADHSTTSVVRQLTAGAHAFLSNSHRSGPARRRHHALERAPARCSDPAHALARVRRHAPGE